MQLEDLSPEATPKQLDRSTSLESTDGVRRSRSESNLFTSPSNKDIVDIASRQLLGEGAVKRLQQEDSTFHVLEQIYPRNIFWSYPRDASAADLVTNRVDSKQRPSLKDARRQKRIQPSSASSQDAHQLTHQRTKMSLPTRFLQFRARILDKFTTMKKAFDTFCHENATTLQKGLNRKEFSRFLLRYFNGLSREDQDTIFEFLDANRNGLVSLSEFHAACEAAAPVRSIEDLRRKLIAVGFTSMRQAIMQMDGSYEKTAQSSSKRLGLEGFATALSRAGVMDAEEHQAIFAAVCEPNDANTASLDELHSAIAAVSPSLLLEDVRDKLLKKFGTLHAAYTKLDLDDNERLTSKEFGRFAVTNLKMTTHEALKAFCVMDIDGNAWISRAEFLSALRLSEPALFLEDLRKKVRQRFRSIREAFCHDENEVSSYEQNDMADIAALAARSQSQDSRVGKAFRRGSIIHKDAHARTALELYPTLSTVNFTEADTKMLFDLVDIDREGKMTSLEFVRGIQLFAPCCVLEDLRLQCLRNSSRCRDAFKRVGPKRRQAVMDLKTFQKLLQDLKLDVGVNIDQIFNLVETRRDGGLALGELFAALQAGAPGVQMPLPPEQRDAKARQQVKWQMAPFHRSAGELRVQMRQTLEKDQEPPRILPMGLVNDPRSYITSSLQFQRRLSRSSPDLRVTTGTSTSSGGLLSGGFGGSLGMYSTAPPGIGFGLSTLGAAGQLQSMPPNLGAPSIDDGSRSLGRASPTGSLSGGMRDALGGASPRSPESPSSLLKRGDAPMAPGSPTKASSVESASDVGGQSPARQKLSPSPRARLKKKRDSMLHEPTKHSYKKISHLVKNGIPDPDNKSLVDRLHGYYLNAGQTIASDESLIPAETMSRMKQYQVASTHRAALERSV